MAQYSPKASAKVERAMHEKKTGTLKSGRSGKPVKSRAQAIAIGLSEAREEGAKVPKAPTKQSAAKKIATKKPAVKKDAAKKVAAKKSASGKTPVKKAAAKKSVGKKTAAK